MLPITKPRLAKGNRLAVVSPASFAKPELVQDGCRRLEQFGYEAVVMPNALARGPLYYAGDVRRRLEDLEAAFSDDEIGGMVCTRGGWGSAELLPLLNAGLFRSHPKVFVGYSDHTSLHAWFWNECGMQTFYAPMVAADWAKEDGVDVASWTSALEGSVDNMAWELNESDGMSVLREGEATGTLLGGCLSILVEALGTPWALRITSPCVLFLEDIGVKPYQWDRMLQHLRFAGMLDHVRGIVLGDMSACGAADETTLIREACLHALRDFTGPIAIGLRCGHLDKHNRSIILGAEVTLSCEASARLMFR